MNIKKLRIEKKLTQKQLAEKSKLPIRTIQKYESEECKIENITLKNAIKLAEGLEIKIKELIN